MQLDNFIERFGPSEREQQQQRVDAIAATWARMIPRIPPPSGEWLEKWARLTDADIGKGITLTARKFSRQKRPIYVQAYKYAGAVMYGAARERMTARGQEFMAEAARNYTTQ